MVSVIIPIYNVETYLSKCLDSVLGQTFSDLEIILVNDGSTDNSDIICEEYAKKDRKIKYNYQKYEGLSSARNTGLCAASGDYILMVDGDDEFFGYAKNIIKQRMTLFEEFLKKKRNSEKAFVIPKS